MRLTSDDRCRLTSQELFKPATPYNATVQPDGSIRLAELVEKQPPIVRPRKVNGRLTGAAIELDRQKVAAAVRADRDER